MRVEVWADMLCPWCYIGKRRFAAALTEFDGPVDVVWRSFLLDPDAPRGLKPQGLSAAERISRKSGMPIEQAREMQQRVASVAASEGMEWRLDDVQAESSFDAHRMLHLARTRGVQTELIESLFRAHFSDGEDISSHDCLERLAVTSGLPESDVAEVLAGERFAEDVHADLADARRIGVSGVPFFVIDGRFALSGSQSSEVFNDALRTAAADRS